MRASPFSTQVWNFCGFTASKNDLFRGFYIINLAKLMNLTCIKHRIIDLIMGKVNKIDIEGVLFADITRLIEESRLYIAKTANATLTLLYWQIGGPIKTATLKNHTAKHTKQNVFTQFFSTTTIHLLP